ncbi:Transcriptional activator [Komagataella phaffii CBS 7435]|uniref:Transcriptional activator related to Msn2p n=2 Tax=Komagataella phaffii TaxID=460519 RepID=C4R1J8_KOMPG|nr:uncharacterized protein PAS_chr2-1_0723 [Komagataella phaffii GS115]AOA62545.1 GQ67_00788T0 [Komagataella phaffii]CAH2448097.1 Transcriptional activator [Komagataella phaffii CBS 7435]AOA67456.1 GQ68_00601T0 [Komagataella phaffii GS115]CAY69372.1 Transcriptional activator related to Msn2p [Komagataella phaffii GS115]CCA38242.1 Transcriptional activator [Komagataella phaffii CBS 7435]
MSTTKPMQVLAPDLTETPKTYSLGVHLGKGKDKLQDPTELYSMILDGMDHSQLNSFINDQLNLGSLRLPANPPAASGAKRGANVSSINMDDLQTFDFNFDYERDSSPLELNMDSQSLMFSSPEKAPCGSLPSQHQPHSQVAAAQGTTINPRQLSTSSASSFVSSDFDVDSLLADEYAEKLEYGAISSASSSICSNSVLPSQGVTSQHSSPIEQRPRVGNSKRLSDFWMQDEAVTAISTWLKAEIPSSLATPAPTVTQISSPSLSTPEPRKKETKQRKRAKSIDTNERSEQVAASNSDDEKQFRCTDCSRRFRRSEHLKRHHRSVHSNERPFHCAHCDKRFSRSDNLSQHLRTHRKQ